MKDQEEKQNDQDIRTLNKASIAEALIAQIPELDRPHAKLIVETFFELIAEHLEKGDTVKIPGLGNFSVRDKVARPGRNLKTGETVTITERRVVTFHPSGTLNAHPPHARRPQGQGISGLNLNLLFSKSSGNISLLFGA